MTKKPRILLYADTYNGRVGTSDAYVNFFSRFGEVVLITPTNDLKFFMEHSDILALPGGADVDPMRYGEVPKESGRSNPHYEFLDKHLLMPWIETKKPIIAICRGMQTLNVALGGSLHQHINDHIGGDNRAARPDTIYTHIPGYNMYDVNSYHHQAVKILADNFDIIGWGNVYAECPSIEAPKNQRPPLLPVYEKIKGQLTPKISKEVYYAIPEIIKHRTRPYIAFQYHPEEFNCALATKLIEEIGVPVLTKDITLNRSYAYL